MRHVVDVGLGAGQQALLAQRLDHGALGLVGGQAGEALAGGRGHPAVLADHRDLLQAVLAADLEVVGIVPGRDLQRAGAEVGLDVLVADDPQAAADERQDRVLADQAGVALVVGIDRDRCVGEHRLRPHRRDGDRPRSRRQRVVDHVERVLHLALLDLEVGDRGAGAGVPVDHVVVAVDQALLVELDEDLRDRLGVGGVHREALVAVVERRAEPLELLGDLRAVVLAPLPDPLDELPRGRRPPWSGPPRPAPARP